MRKYNVVKCTKLLSFPFIKIFFFSMYGQFDHFKQPCKQKVAKKFWENCQKVVKQFHCVRMHQAINKNRPGGLVSLII